MGSRNYPANTQIQKFLEESYNKERDTRLGWWEKNQSGGPGSGSAGKSKQFEVFKKKIEINKPSADGLLGKVPTDVKEASYRKKVSKLDDTLLTKEISSGADYDGGMRPITPDVKAKLYDGFTKEGKGRYQYLTDRNCKNPEVKYPFPVSSSMEYGWRLGDVIKKEDFRKPKNGRSRIVADTFYTRTGIPDHPSCSV